MTMPIIRSTPLTAVAKNGSPRPGRARTHILAAKAEALYEAAESLPEVAHELRRLARTYLTEAGNLAVSEQYGDSAARRGGPQ